jgi:hypothetical protein
MEDDLTYCLYCKINNYIVKSLEGRMVSSERVILNTNNNYN